MSSEIFVSVSFFSLNAVKSFKINKPVFFFFYLMVLTSTATIGLEVLALVWSSH